ncbi:MAG: ion channel [Gammaproteobacteria bacterium]
MPHTPSNSIREPQKRKIVNSKFVYPFLFSQIKISLLKHFTELRWYTVLITTSLYTIAVWVAMYVCNEHDLTESDHFIYWLLVTASTVGYGDYSPSTVAGKWVVVLFVIPVGLILFGLILGRLAAFISYQWRKGARGLNSIDYTDHILIIGWNNRRTLSLIRLLQQDSGHLINQKKIVLMVSEEMENPLPGEIGFVRTSNCSAMEELKRANIFRASCIIINGESDEVTMTVSLACATLNPTAHIIAYFNKEGIGSLLKKHCPNIECVPSVSVEMMARSALDPGSSELHHQLLDPHTGMTQYSSEYVGDTTTVRKLYITMKEKYNATLIGIAEDKSKPLVLNPDLSKSIEPGNRIHYISKKRIESLTDKTVTF